MLGSKGINSAQVNVQDNMQVKKYWKALRDALYICRHAEVSEILDFSCFVGFLVR